MTTINDREWAFLAEQTGEPGPFNDMYFKYLRGLGYTGTLQDMIAAFGEGYTPSRIVTSLNSLMAAQSDGLYFDTTKTDRFFQENTGPTLANDVGEAMGLALDQRTWGGKTLTELLAGQTELVTNGDFSSGLTGWNQSHTGASTVTVSNGVATFNTNGVDAARIRRSFATVAGRTYRLERQGNANLAIGTSEGGSQIIGFGTLSGVFFVATTTTTWVSIHSSVNGSTVSSVSVKEVPGKHGIQASATLKPTRQTTGAKFDATDDVLNSGYVASGSEEFIIALVSVPASLPTNQTIAGSGSGSDVRYRLSFTTAGRVAGAVGTQTETTILGSVDRRGTEVVAGISINGGTVRLFDDDAIAYEGAQSGSHVSSIPVAIGSVRHGGVYSQPFGGSIKKLVAGRQFLDLATYLKIRNALLAA